MADGVRVGHQLGGLPEVSAGAGGIHQRTDLALPDDRPGEHGVTGCAGRGQRLPGQRGLVDLDLVAVQQPGVGGDNVTQAQADHITGHQLPRRRGDPCAVAFHPRVDRELGLEGLNRVASLSFLGVADYTVGQQQQQDDEEIRPVPDRAGQDDGDLDHPRDRAPKVAEELQQRVGLVLGDLIRPVLRQPSCRLSTAQSVRRVAQLFLQLGHRRRFQVLARFGCARRAGRREMRRVSSHGVCSMRRTSACCRAVSGRRGTLRTLSARPSVVSMLFAEGSRSSCGFRGGLGRGC